MRLAGDTTRQIRQQIQRRAAQFVERDAAAERRMLLLERKHRARIANAGARQRAHRPRRNRVDANAIAAEIGGEITSRGLQRRLGDAHYIVIRHHAGRAAECQRHHRAAIGHQLRRARRHFCEGEAGDHHGAREVRARGIDIAALQFVLVRETDGMDEKIHLAPCVLDRIERGVNAGDILDIARQNELGAERFRERFHPPAKRLALIGEG
ncbi:ABC-type oligopeptide transport system, periplasmic component [Afipia felis]|uniref:ABC-type oligopeptide transport system, periplasmic component n=1 Tax=Afipia felis TaxID=1035 RepID=A0A090N8C9_AFIFE|nr:ABC-type oligopeptide transport system, periplasmic component [Afipia felis]